jgi:opacity protein-like surface antigen
MKGSIAGKGVLALGITMLAATPAYAESGPYVGISAGLALPENSENAGEFTGTVPATPDFGEIPNGTPLGWTTDFDNGLAIGGQVGYAFDNGIRVELEGSYTEYDVNTHFDLAAGGAIIDDVDVAVLTRGPADPANPTVGAVIATPQGDKVSNLGLFGNVFYDIQAGGGFKPYIGAGIGFQSTDVRYTPSGVPVGEGSDESFAYQLMAGASFDVSESFAIFGQYTYRANTSRAEIDLDLVPANLGIESSQSIISAGVRVRL